MLRNVCSKLVLLDGKIIDSLVSMVHSTCQIQLSFLIYRIRDGAVDQIRYDNKYKIAKCGVIE